VHDKRYGTIRTEYQARHQKRLEKEKDEHKVRHEQQRKEHAEVLEKRRAEYAREDKSGPKIIDIASIRESEGKGKAHLKELDAKIEKSALNKEVKRDLDAAVHAVEKDYDDVKQKLSAAVRLARPLQPTAPRAAAPRSHAHPPHVRVRPQLGEAQRELKAEREKDGAKMNVLVPIFVVMVALVVVLGGALYAISDGGYRASQVRKKGYQKLGQGIRTNPND
jgi:hypothetical protein